MSLFPIRTVIIYTGHRNHPLLGPYMTNVQKRIEMFTALNFYRQARGRDPWHIKPVSGENLLHALDDPKYSLLVIPAGQSTHLDEVFSSKQLTFLKKFFFEQGGRGYFNCGSAFWVSQKRIYSDVCAVQPTQRNVIEKESRLPLFSGTATGPICMHPSPSYKVGFYLDAIQVTNSNRTCTILLSGGGSFQPKPGDAHVKVIAKYPHSELMRCGKTAQECPSIDIAAILLRLGKGGAVLSMFHPYYSSQDIDPVRYEQAFPGSGTNWKRIVKQLSSDEERLGFVLEKFLFPLEDLYRK